jgi:hypothetical protein
VLGDPGRVGAIRGDPEPSRATRPPAGSALDSAFDQDIHVSRDLRYVVFSSNVSGDGELYEASR